MNWRAVFGSIIIASLASGCALLEHTACAPNCRSESRNSSSLVGFLYPAGDTPPSQNASPVLPLPLRVGLAFLPSRTAFGGAPLDDAHKQELLERIRKRFSDRHFVSEIVIIPDYYLTNAQGFTGLQGAQRLYNVDLMALVSYDQVTYNDDDKWSLGYLTIVGAYLIKGSINDTVTLVDLAVVDPKTRALVLRAGGTDTRHQKSTLLDVQRVARSDGALSFDEATTQMITHFDDALTVFERDVRAGNSNVHVVARNANSPGGSGGGATSGWELVALSMLALGGMRRTRFSDTYL